MNANIFLNDEEGQSMVETALIVALISIAAIVALQLFGDALGKYYKMIKSKVSDTPK